MSTPTPWVMPDWMEPCRSHFSNTGGNSIEDLVNKSKPNNLAWGMLAVSVESQIILLNGLHAAGLLVSTTAAAPEQGQ